MAQKKKARSELDKLSKRLFEIFFRVTDGRSMVNQRHYTRHDEKIENADGTLSLRMRVYDLTEVRSWVLSWGDKVKVCAPASLRAEIADMGRNIAKLYGT